ncbi:MAG: MBL fold metallo-hydrolase [Acidobacteria bacterium]|nr:MBL fold metallo-hydrolase [Acidobacteriota bacterium]
MTLRVPMMRAVLLTLLLGIVVSGDWSAMKAQSAFSLIQVVPDLYFYYTGGGSNSTVLITEEGVLIVDSQGNRRAAEALLAEIRKKTAAPIKWVVNGQDHGDHYLGNAVFKREGAVIVAEAETARIIGRNYEYELEWRGLDPARAGEHVIPDVTFRDRMTIRLGGREVILFHIGAGQNPGDTIVLFPHARAAYPSGALAPKSWSSTAYASSLDSWIAVLEKIRALDVDTYLPGHAHMVTDRAEIDEEIVFLREIKAAVESAIAKGLTAEETAKALTFERYASWRGSNPARRERNIRNVHYLLSTGRPIYFDYLDGRTTIKPY